MKHDARLRGAGGTQGGVGAFFLGLGMMIAGGYLFLRAVRVSAGFALGMPLLGSWAPGAEGLTTGMVLIPLLIGIAGIFYDAERSWGWLLTLASLLALGVGIVASVNFSLVGMSAFDLFVILGLLAGGLGVFLRSLR